MQIYCLVLLVFGFFSSTIGPTVKPKVELNLEVIYLKQRAAEMEGRVSVLENQLTNVLRVNDELRVTVREAETKSEQEKNQLLVKLGEMEMESTNRRNDVSVKLQELVRRVTEVETLCGKSTANVEEKLRSAETRFKKIDNHLIFEILQLKLKLKEAVERVRNVKEEFSTALENQRRKSHSLQVQMTELNSELHSSDLIQKNMDNLSLQLNESLTIGLENIQTNLTRNMRIFEKSSLNFLEDCANLSYVSKLDENLKSLEKSAKKELGTVQSEMSARLENLEVRSVLCDDVPEMKKTLTNHSSQLSSLNKHLWDIEKVDKLAPAFSLVPDNVSVSEGSSSVLPCDTLHPNASIRWLKGEVLLAEEAQLPGLLLMSNGSLWIKNMGSHLTGVYTCIAVWSERQVATVTQVTMVEDGLPCDVEFRLRPSDSEIEEGELGHLVCQAEGALSWLKDGRPLKTGDRVTMFNNGYVVLPRVRLEDAGTYTCVAEFGNGCIGKAAATLKVTPKARIQDICGVSRVGRNLSQSELGKIVGGSDALEGAYPWQAMLWYPGRGPFCGATLLNERWVVTAAHCIFDIRGKKWTNLRILLGKHKRVRGEETEEEFRLSEPTSIVVHPEFRIIDFENNVALIRMDHRVTFSERVLPVCLAEQNVTESLLRPGQMGLVIGWGRLKEIGAFPIYLQEIRLPVVDQEQCLASTTFTVTRNLFCAGYSQDVIGDACNGDSGDPFLMSHNGRWHLVGVVSWGEGCGRSGKYGFYTRLANHMAWIRSVIES